MMKHSLLTLIGISAAALSAAAAEPPAKRGWSALQQQGAIRVSNLDRPVLAYQLERPADSKLPVEGACYFHPVMTPSGVVVTDVNPKDHPHHRGIFLAWVETHGKKDADFWGWGEPAPTKGRKIVFGNSATTGATQDGATFTVHNEWVADGETVLREALTTSVRTDATAKANVIDLTYTLTPTSDLTLSRWAFSGFCVRARGEGKLTAFGPGGEVKLPNPSHLKPESDWPDAAWYGYTLKFDDGKVAGVAVINHPHNPPTLWHNHRDIRMLNPCIVAPGEVKLKANQPLVLRYRVVAHDGPTPVEALDRLASEWAKEETRGQGDTGTRGAGQ
jgi:hypothetical protein